jgi:hypothetical protein
MVSDDQAQHDPNAEPIARRSNERDLINVQD